MFFIKTIFIASMTIVLFGCKETNKNVSLYFNPASTRELNEIHIEAKFNNEIILDTILLNNHIDNSLFLKSIEYNSNQKNTLSVKINGISTFIRIPTAISKCTEIFLAYDDYTLLMNSASKIRDRKMEHSEVADYKKILDSLKKSKIGIYDKIEIYIKPRDCL